MVIMGTLAGQRAKFTLALNQYNLTDDEVARANAVAKMAHCIQDAPNNGLKAEDVTQGQSYPADEVKLALARLSTEPVSEESEEAARAILESRVDASDVIREGEGSGVVYVYGYRCASDRLKIGCTKEDAVQRIAAQIWTSTPDKPVLLIEIRTDAFRAVERALHGILEARGKKINGGGAEWFRTTREEVLAIYRFVQNGAA